MIWEFEMNRKKLLMRIYIVIKSLHIIRNLVRQKSK